MKAPHSNPGAKLMPIDIYGGVASGVLKSLLHEKRARCRGLICDDDERGWEALTDGQQKERLGEAERIAAECEGIDAALLSRVPDDDAPSSPPPDRGYSRPWGRAIPLGEGAVPPGFKPLRFEGSDNGHGPGDGDGMVMFRGSFTPAGQGDFPMMLNNQPTGRIFSGTDGKIFRAYTNRDRLSNPADDQRLPNFLGSFLQSVVFGRPPADPQIKAALSENTFSTGGIFVPGALSSRIIDLARAQTKVVAAGAETLPVDSPSVTLAKIISDPVPTWRSENVEIGFSEPNFGALVLTARSLAVAVKLSLELVDDSAANLDQVVSNLLAQAIALEIDRVALYGSGLGSEPRGLSKHPANEGMGYITSAANGDQLTDYGKFSTAMQTLATANVDVDRDPSIVSGIFHPRTLGILDRIRAVADGQYLAPPPSWAKFKKFSTSQVSITETQGNVSTASRVFMGAFSSMIIAVRQPLQISVSREAGASDGSSAFTQHQLWLKAVTRVDVGIMRDSDFVQVTGLLP